MTPRPATPGVLLAAVEQHLHADADAEERPARRDRVERGVLEPGAHAARPCTPRTRRRRAAPRRRRRAISAGVGGERGRRRPRCSQRLLRRVQVADAVVEHRDQRSRSLPPPLTARPWSTARRADSTRTASRRQRARPLNVASMMWCTLRPRRRLTCSVMPAFVANDDTACSASWGSNAGLPSGRLSGIGTSHATNGRPDRSSGDLDRAPRRAGTARWRSGGRRPCRRAPRGTPRRARSPRPRPCGGCRCAGRPSACTVRSKPPWRPSWSSMWS